MFVTESILRKNVICSITVANTLVQNFTKIMQTLNCRYQVTRRYRCEGIEVVSIEGSFIILHRTYNSWSLFSILLKSEGVNTDATKAYGVERRCIVTHFLPRHQTRGSFQFIPKVTFYYVRWYVLLLANTHEFWEENNVSCSS